MDVKKSKKYLSKMILLSIWSLLVLHLCLAQQIEDNSETQYLFSFAQSKGPEVDSVLSASNFDVSIFSGYDYARFIYGVIPEDAATGGFEEMPENARKIYQRKSLEKIKYDNQSKLKVKNSKGNENISEIIFYVRDNQVDFSSKLIKTQINNGETVDVELVLPGRFNSFQFKDLKFDINKSLKIEDLPKGSEAMNKINIFRKNEVKAYAMDLAELNFTSGRYYDYAEGRELWKCKDWNFEQQICFGFWVKMMDLIPGTEYSFEISPVDPAYVEVFDTGSAIDVDIAALGNETLVLVWVDGDAGNHVSFEVWNTRGINLVDETDIDSTGDVNSAVAVTAINSTHFVVGWVDSPIDDLYHTGYTKTGVNFIANAALDTNVGVTSDVDVCGLGDRYAVINAGTDDSDADFWIRSNEGASLVAETAVDTTMSPGANNQNLVSCSLFNSNAWAYAYFDDADNDASVFIRALSGGAVGTVLDIDNNVGETGQVAVAGLRNNRYAYVYYDSGLQDIFMTVRSMSGTTHTTVLANTAIDTDAGTFSRVDVAEIEFSGSSYFAVAWFDQSDTTIKAGVYNESGSQITAPFTVTNTPTESYPIVSVTGTYSTLDFGLCNGTFAIAYTNSSGDAVFETYWYNATRWDGECSSVEDNVAPKLQIIGPANNTVNTTSLIIDFFYNVTDASAFVNCSLYINDELNQTKDIVSQGVVENLTTDLENGEYTWKITCIDRFGNSNTSAIYNLNVSVFFLSNDALDIDIDSLDLETLVMTWVSGEISNPVSFEVWNTNQTRLLSQVDVDTTGDTGSAVAVASVNTSHFVIGWVDSPVNDLMRIGYAIDGTNYLSNATLDANIGTISDVDVCQLGDRYAAVNANQADSDADFRIQSNTGVGLVGETAVDGATTPGANNQNLVSCSLFNSNAWAYAYFDDADNDASVFVRDLDGGAVGAALDIDTDVGETGQVAVAGLRNNRYAYVYYDSVLQDIFMTVRSMSGTTHTTVLANTAIDTDAGTESRVDVAEVEFSGSSYFAVAWFDQSDTTIKAGVYNESGAQITAPFTVSINPASPSTIVSVTGTHSGLGFGLCNGTFAVAYTNSSGMGVFRTYWYNSTTWNGTCPDYDAPNVTLQSPANNTLNKSSSIIYFEYLVTDRTVVSNCSLYINNVLNQTNDSITKDTNMGFVVNISNGVYTWKVGCTDSSGNIANSSSYNLNVSWYQPVIQRVSSTNTVMLNPGSTKRVECNATVYEGNGAIDILNVSASLFRSNTSLFDSEDDNYHYTNSSCAALSSSGNMSNYTCSFQVQYYALNGSWNCTVVAYDVDYFSGVNTTTSFVEPLYALNLSTESLEYGDMSPGNTSIDKSINITNLGNMNINITVHGYGGDNSLTGAGYAMRCVSGENISVNNQRYSTLSGMNFNQKNQLTSLPVHLNLTMQKQTLSNTLIINNSYWQLYVPPMPSVTQCNGTIVFTVASP
ncbi:MAG: hypothetical protein ACP5N2_06305 [Candidatus Nanoarchaeia archaeon]